MTRGVDFRLKLLRLFFFPIIMQILIGQYVTVNQGCLQNQEQVRNTPEHPQDTPEHPSDGPDPPEHLNYKKKITKPKKNLKNYQGINKYPSSVTGKRILGQINESMPLSDF